VIQAAAYSEDWMQDVCAAVWRAPNLRQSITLAASLLEELLEYEIKSEGWDPDWRHNLCGFCAVLGEPTDERSDDWTDEDQELDEWVWATAGEVLELYSRLNELTDWEVYSEACSDVPRIDELGDRAAVARWAYSAALAYVHGYVTRAR
jgi:hypothetical protein